MVHGHVWHFDEIKEADYQTTCCCCFKTRVARGGLAHENGLKHTKHNCLAVSPFHGFAWNKKKFNELEHETAHRMHEKLDFRYLSEFFPFLSDMNVPSVSYASARSQYIINWAATQCGILTSVVSDEPAVQPPFKLTNSKRCSVSSLTLIEYSSDLQRLWSDCSYAQADLRRCWSHIPHCWKSHVTAQLYSFEASDAKSDVSLHYQFLVCLFVPDLVWQDVGDLSGSKLFANFESRW